MKETDLYLPMKEWFKQRGYEVRPEVCTLGRIFDAIAVKRDIVVAIEMKLSLTKKLFDQIKYGHLFADYSYSVIGSIPRIESETLNYHLNDGIGILSIRNNIVKELYPPKKHTKPVDRYHQQAIDYIKKSKDEGIGGSANLKGIGPAQTVEKLVEEYRKKHPHITWKELYEKVPNHYSSYRSMQGAMRMIPERRYWNERMKEQRKKEKEAREHTKRIHKKND